MRTITGDVWADTEVVSLARKAKTRLYCVAYVTRTSHALFRAGDILVCDSSRKAVACGETDPAFLKLLIKMGGKFTLVTHCMLNALSGTMRCFWAAPTCRNLLPRGWSNYQSLKRINLWQIRLPISLCI